MDEIIGQIEKNRNTLALVRLTTFNGKDYIDIREHYENKVSGKLEPTKKGISLPVSTLSELVNLVEQAEAKYAAINQ